MTGNFRFLLGSILSAVLMLGISPAMAQDVSADKCMSLESASLFTSFAEFDFEGIADSVEPVETIELKSVPGLAEIALNDVESPISYFDLLKPEAPEKVILAQLIEDKRLDLVPY